LKAGLDAHSTLKSIYGDSSQPAAVRVRAASAALNVETPSLKPQSPPLDLPCEEIEPLAVLVEKRRARMNQLLAMPLEERAALIPGCGNGGNGSGD
jgi:hypothetical protein